MFLIVIYFLNIYTHIQCASYQRFGESTPYPSYSTISNLYNQNQFPYKTNYGSDISPFPEATRYPNYRPGYSSTRPDTYNIQTGNPLFQSNPRYGQNSYGSFQRYDGVSSYGSLGSEYNGQNYGQGYTSYETPFLKYNRDYCVNRSPQTGIWVDSLTGMWYGVEVIQHLGGDSRIDYVKNCIIIHISEPHDKPSTENQYFHVQHINAKFEHEYRHLRLLWNEAGETIEYALYFRNDSAGYWQAFNGQNGTIASRSEYQQFSGTVQVLKAVNDHLVLNFCQEATTGSPAQLYSVLFSREAGTMLRWEIDAVHALLQNKKLSVASRRMVCGNNAGKIMYNLTYSIVSCLLAYILRYS